MYKQIFFVFCLAIWLFCVYSTWEYITLGQTYSLLAFVLDAEHLLGQSKESQMVPKLAKKKLAKMAKR